MTERSYHIILVKDLWRLAGITDALNSEKYKNKYTLQGIR